MTSTASAATPPRARSRSLSRLTRRVIWFLLGNTAVIAVLQLTAPPGDGGTVLHALHDFVHVRQGDDSWLPMTEAWHLLQSDPHVSLYQTLFFDRHTKFQYPPSALLAFEPWRVVHAVVPGLSAARALAIVSWLLTVVTIVLSIRLFEDGVEREGLVEDPHAVSPYDATIRRLALLALGLTFYPLIRGYSLGQIQVWLDALMAGAVWSWSKDRKGVAGALVGAAALVKPQYALIALWGVVRRERYFVAGVLATAVPGLAVSIARFGWANHLGYLDVLRYVSRHGESYYTNQSVNGFMNRLLRNGDNLNWHDESFAPYNAWVYIVTLLSSALLIGAALFSRRPSHERGETAWFCMIALTSTLASPVAWEHHYGILLPIFACVIPMAIQHRTWGRATMPVVVCSYVLAGNLFDHTRSLADTPLNVLQSYLLLAAGLVLVYLYTLSGTDANGWRARGWPGAGDVAARAQGGVIAREMP